MFLLKCRQETLFLSNLILIYLLFVVGATFRKTLNSSTLGTILRSLKKNQQNGKVLCFRDFFPTALVIVCFMILMWRATSVLLQCLNYVTYVSGGIIFTFSLLIRLSFDWVCIILLNDLQRIWHSGCLLAWENSRHFATPSLVYLQNEVRETSAGITYWWRIATQI